MIKRSSEMSTVIAQGEIGTCKCLNFLDENESYGAGNLFAICSIAPGDKTAYHKHVTEYEVYYLLEGDAKLIQDDVEYILKAGDTCLCPIGSSHSIMNIGQDELKFVALMLFAQK